VIKQMHDRLVQIAQASKVVQGRKMRVDTTVVATDGSLLGDGVRVLVRSMHDRREVARSEPQREGWVLEIARAARGKAPLSRERLKGSYGRLLLATGGTGQTLLQRDRRGA
jgi:hypothetical protein